MLGNPFFDLVYALAETARFCVSGLLLKVKICSIQLLPHSSKHFLLHIFQRILNILIERLWLFQINLLSIWRGHLYDLKFLWLSLLKSRDLLKVKFANTGEELVDMLVYFVGVFGLA